MNSIAVLRRSLPMVCLIVLLVAGGCRSAATPDGAARAADPVSHFAKYGPARIHYTTVGQGPQTVVLIHGWSCNADFWREQVPALADKARVILIDLPGHGLSDAPRTNYTLDYFAGAVIAVLNDARAARGVLVGHSLGTPVICRVYAFAPERVAALVAVDGVLRRPKMQPGAAEGFIGPFRTPAYRAQMTNFVNSTFTRPGTAALRDWVLAEMLATPQYVMSSAMDNMFDTRPPAWDLARVNVPVLVINARSPMWTADYEAYVRALSATNEYRVIEDAGHFVMLEKPAEFNAALLAMLDEFGLIRK